MQALAGQVHVRDNVFALVWSELLHMRQALAAVAHTLTAAGDAPPGTPPAARAGADDGEGGVAAALSPPASGLKTPALVALMQGSPAAAAPHSGNVGGRGGQPLPHKGPRGAAAGSPGRGARGGTAQQPLPDLGDGAAQQHVISVASKTRVQVRRWWHSLALSAQGTHCTHAMHTHTHTHALVRTIEARGVGLLALPRCASVHERSIAQRAHTRACARQVSALVAQLASLQQDADARGAALSALRRDKEELSSRLEDAEGAAEGAQARLLALQASYAELDGGVGALRGELEAARAQVRARRFAGAIERVRKK